MLKKAKKKKGRIGSNPTRLPSSKPNLKKQRCSNGSKLPSPINIYIVPHTPAYSQPPPQRPRFHASKTEESSNQSPH